MTAKLNEILKSMNQWMDVDKVKDYCPNGLQVEGKEDVSKILLGVTACQALVDKAIEIDADLILVHHGYFWKGESPVVSGMKRNRLKSLLVNDISMAAYHLPLDIHPEFGNNAQLGVLLGLELEKYHKVDGLPLMAVGKLQVPQSIDEWSLHIAKSLGREPLLLKSDQGVKEVSRVAWCTGGAQGFIGEALSLGVDAYLSGEVSEPTFHTVVEEGIHYISAGHHATERYGIQALGEKIAGTFDVTVSFFDVDNPV